MFLIFGALFLLLFGRFLYIQVTGEVHGRNLQAEAASKYARETLLKAERGRILDRNSNIIVEDTQSYRLVAIIDEKATEKESEPRHVIDKRKTAQVLAEYIDLEEERIYELLNPAGELYQVEFGKAGRDINHELKEKINALELPGITFLSDKKRYYPNGSFAAHLIGFAVNEEQKDGSFKEIGRMGLEQTYNEELSGVDGKISFQKDRFGIPLPNSEKNIIPAKDGKDIYLTLDKTIQNFLEDAMTRVQNKFNPVSVVAVVANPKTGEILGLSQRPTFDPDTRTGLDTNWLNDAVGNVLEPGSTMKIFTVAAAIDSGNWHPNATYQSGSYTLYGTTIRDHNKYGWGPITYLEGFRRSSNTAMAHQLEIMGSETFYDYLDRFGFGHKTGINLENEASGTLLNQNPIDRVTTTYGQGSTVTPMQLIQATTAVANGGKMMQPYIIDKIVDPNTGKVTYNQEPVEKGTPITAETAEQLLEILASTVTTDEGTGQRYKIEGYDVAGKTGTAQIPKATGGYYRGNHQYVYSFLGMAPADDPKLIMYVAVKEPRMSTAIAGNEPVAQIFNPVMENALKYLNIDPNDAVVPALETTADYTADDAETAKQSLEAVGFVPIVIGEGGQVTGQYPLAGLQLPKGSIVFLQTEGAVTLPDFTGWSLRNMLAYQTLSGLSIQLVGEGFVESQSASAGTIVTDSAPIVVNLKTPEESYARSVEKADNEAEPVPQD